jgi:lambda repressor-like predicted transcriptional regulator
MTSDERQLLMAAPIQAELERHRAYLREIARESGVSSRTLRRIVNGHSMYVRRHNAEPIAIAMGTHITQIYGP